MKQPLSHIKSNVLAFYLVRFRLPADFEIVKVDFPEDYRRLGIDVQGGGKGVITPPKKIFFILPLPFKIYPYPTI